jgi:hypothetical protein
MWGGRIAVGRNRGNDQVKPAVEMAHSVTRRAPAAPQTKAMLPQKRPRLWSNGVWY